MRAVVVELNKNQAAVLSDDGCVMTVPNNNYEIGQVIRISAPKQNNIVKKLTAFAATAAACLLLGVGTWAYASPYAYVSVDVNPSIEFSINRFDRVIKVKAVNDDGAEILQELSLEDLTNNSIMDAITKTVEQISEAGYFDGETEGGIVIATSSEDTEKAEELATELKETVEQETEDNGDDVVVEAFSVGLERVTQAKELGVTPGKLNLVEKLQEEAGNTDDINLEEWLNKPVKEIMKATKEYRKANENSQEASEDASGTVTEDNSGNSTDTEAAIKNDKSNGKSNPSNNVGKKENDSDKSSGNADKDADKAQKDADKAQKKADKAEQKADKTQGKSDSKTPTVTGGDSITDDNTAEGSGESGSDSNESGGNKNNKSDQSSGSKKNQSNSDQNNKGDVTTGNQPSSDTPSDSEATSGDQEIQDSDDESSDTTEDKSSDKSDTKGNQDNNVTQNNNNSQDDYANQDGSNSDGSEDSQYNGNISDSTGQNDGSATGQDNQKQNGDSNPPANQGSGKDTKGNK